MPPAGKKPKSWDYEVLGARGQFQGGPGEWEFG